jgi:hypothetical protein
MVIRRHRDDALRMRNEITAASRLVLCAFAEIGEHHPVCSSRPYKVFLCTAADVRGRIAYVEGNPEKEGLPKQRYDFVQSYNDWPFHKVHAALG